MIVEGEDELICDFAEYYHIYDYRQLPVVYCATLAVGLREDSRIVLKLTKQKGTYEQKLMTLMYDVVNMIRYFHTQDGAENVNRPESLYSVIFEDKKQVDKSNDTNTYMRFSSGEDFKKAWNKEI